MPNPFYVQPASFERGFQGLFEGVQSRADLERKKIEAAGIKAEEEAEEARREKIRSEAADLLKLGVSKGIAEMAIKHPWLSDDLLKSAKYLDEETRNNALEGAKKVLIGGADPSGVLIDRAELVISKGGDATETMAMAEEAQADPSNAIKQAEMAVALQDPEAFKQYQKMKEVKTGKLTDKQIEYNQAVEQGFQGSMMEYQMTLGGKDKTQAIREFEYGQKNPKFAAIQKGKLDNKKTKEVAGKTFENASKLRKEFLSQSSEYQKVRDSYTRVIGSTKDPSPAGDLSLIFNYMKMLDPGSVVRESEFATAASAGSYGDRIQANVQKVLSGERLSKTMRADFLKKSGVLLKGMESQHNKRAASYKNIAEKNDLPVDEVVVDITAPPEYQEGQIAVGPNGQKIIFTAGEWRPMQ